MSETPSTPRVVVAGAGAAGSLTALHLARTAGRRGTPLEVVLLDPAPYPARGTAFDSVQVEEFLTTALKGNKQEYDYMGTAQVTCARALFPHGGAPACWWVRRHRTEWE